MRRQLPGEPQQSVQERVGAALSLPFAGVHIVEATKQVYRAIPAHRERTRLIPALQPVLVPSGPVSPERPAVRTAPSTVCFRRTAACTSSARRRRPAVSTRVSSTPSMRRPAATAHRRVVSPRRP